MKKHIVVLGEKYVPEILTFSGWKTIKKKEILCNQGYKNGVTFFNSNIIQRNLDMTPLFVRRNSWRYTAGVRKPKYCTKIGNFWGLNEGGAISVFDSTSKNFVTRWRNCLRHSAGSIPDGVTGIIH